MKTNYMVLFLLGFTLMSALPAPATAMPQGIVRLEGRTLVDSSGPFLGLGSTYMQALRHCKYDRPRLHKELSFLASCGFNYVRVLSMVDWPGQEISPVDYRNDQGTPIAAWPDYDRQLMELVDLVYTHGLRTQVTIFADAQRIMPDEKIRQMHLQRILKLLEGREEKIILYEIANEAWQNGFSGTEGISQLRALGQDIAQRSHSLLALSSPPDMEPREDALRRLYLGSAAHIATVHFSRDLRSETGPWLPVIDCWNLAQQKDFPPLSSNEPVGPGASVASEDDPEMILSAASFAWLAGLPMYVFHSAAGVKAEHSFESMPWLKAMASLISLLPPDLPNWERPDSALLVPVRPSGDFRYDRCARKGSSFLQIALALDGGERTYRASEDLSFQVFSLRSPHKAQEKAVGQGASFTLKTDSKACLIIGSVR